MMVQRCLCSKKQMASIELNLRVNINGGLHINSETSLKKLIKSKFSTIQALDWQLMYFISR